MVRGKGLAGAAMIAALALVAGGCGALSGDGDGASGASKEIEIGLLAPLTGDSAADGQGMKEGAEAAIKELNAKGGVAGHTFRLKAIDTQNLQSDRVAAGAQQLISDPAVKAVVTSYASGNNFEIDTFAKAKMPYLVAANADQTEALITKNPSKYPTIWSIVPAYKPFGTDLPAVIEQWGKDGKLQLRDKSAFVITSDNPFSQGISKGLLATMRQRGWNIKGEETVPFGAVNDWGSILAKIHKANPDLIVDTDYLPANEAGFLKQFTASPSKSILFMQYGPSIPEFLQLTKKTSTGVLYNLLGDPIDSPRYPRSKALFDQVSRLTGTPAAKLNNQVLTTYQEIQIYAAALKQVGDPDKKVEIGKAIGASSYPGAGGMIRFDPATHLAVYGDSGQPLQFLQIRDGKRVQLLPSKYATGSFQTPPWD
jgi:branched-chain amino acid transport system substrate-binding protein